MQGNKVIIIGDSAVGKTSLLFRYVFNHFDMNSMPTLGAGFKTKEVQWEDNKGGHTIKLQIWDTAG